MGQLISLVASCHNSGRSGSKAEALVLKGFLKSSRAATTQSRSDSRFTGRNFIKNIRSYWRHQNLMTNDITITWSVQYPHCYNDGYTVQTFKHSGGEKLAEFSNETDETTKLATGGCILFTVILLTLFL